MNRTRALFLGSLALALGAFVCFVVYKTQQTGTRANNEPGIDVVVAANDLQVGARLEEKDIRVVSVPPSVASPNCFRSKLRVLGRVVILPIQKSECILPYKVGLENVGSGLPTLIPPGMRAVSVRVTDIIAVAGFVVPGTRVDVLLTGNPSRANEPQTITILENVAVVAQMLERNAAGERRSASVITLLVSPDDGQKLTLASSQGHIQIALRNPLAPRRGVPLIYPPVYTPLGKAIFRNNG